MDDADRQLADMREFRDLIAKLIGYYERGEFIRPLGQDAAEATALHLARLKAEKAYADDLIPKLETMNGTRGRLL